jgi:hypothetical protein
MDIHGVVHDFQRWLDPNWAEFHSPWRALGRQAVHLIKGILKEMTH